MEAIKEVAFSTTENAHLTFLPSALGSTIAQKIQQRKKAEYNMTEWEMIDVNRTAINLRKSLNTRVRCAVRSKEKSLSRNSALLP